MVCYFLVILLLGASTLINSFDSLPTVSINDTSAAKPVAQLTDDMPKYATSINFGNSTCALRDKVVTVLVSINYSGILATGPISTKSMELALDRLRSQDNWLTGYDLAIELIDDKCGCLAYTVEKIMNQLQLSDPKDQVNRLPLFFITTCGCQETSAEVLNYYNVTGMAMTTNNVDLLFRRSRYRHYFGLGESYEKPYIAFAHFAAQMGWKQIAVISEINPFYNTLDSYFFLSLNENNVTLGFVGKVGLMSTDENEMAKTLEELRDHDQRIIFVNADGGIGIACWLHRYGMFGPNYVLGFVNWVYSTPVEAEIPDYVETWCTQEMIGQVFEGAFFIGDSSLLDVYGEDIVDSTGATGRDFLTGMRAKIEDPEKNSGWQYWRTIYYDAALYIGIILNKTENMLNGKNQTLVEWSMASGNFRDRSFEITNTIEEAIYSTRVNGLKGIYEFDRETTSNSKGYTPATVVQVRNAEDLSKSPDQFVVAIYQSNNKRNALTIRYDAVKWRTKDGQPPRDRTLVILVETNLIPTAATLTALAAASILLHFVLFVVKMLCYFKIEDAFFSPGKVAILFGNIVMAVGIFFVPSSRNMTKEIGNWCMAMFTFFAIGYSSSIAGLFTEVHARNVLVKSSKWLRKKVNKVTPATHANPPLKQRSVRATLAKMRRSLMQSRATRPAQREIFRGRLILLRLNIIWFILIASLDAAYFAVDPLTTQLFNGTRYSAEDDDSLQYQTYAFQPVNDGSNAGIGIAAVFGCLQVVVFFETLLRAYKIRLVFKAKASIWICLTCVILMFIASAFLLIILGTDFIVAVIPCTVILYVSITFALIFLKKIQPFHQPVQRSKRLLARLAR